MGADHADGGAVTYDSNPCDNGMVIDGNDVTMYGLAVEHTEKDLTIWNGENGLPISTNQSFHMA